MGIQPQSDLRVVEGKNPGLGDVSDWSRVWEDGRSCDNKIISS